MALEKKQLRMKYGTVCEEVVGVSVSLVINDQRRAEIRAAVLRFFPHFRVPGVSLEEVLRYDHSERIPQIAARIQVPEAELREFARGISGESKALDDTLSADFADIIG